MPVKRPAVTEQSSPLSLSKAGVALVVVAEAVLIFFLAQAMLRIFSLRDTVSDMQTELARVQVRQEQFTVLMQNKLDNIQKQLDRIEQKR